MKYKFVHHTATPHEQEPDPELLKYEIIQAFAEKLMESTTIERIEEPGRIVHKATVTVLHDKQVEYIKGIINILLSSPHTAMIGRDLRRELNDM